MCDKFFRRSVAWLALSLCIRNVVCDLSGADVALQGQLSASSAPTGLGCHRRLYTYRITQSDENGHECWDNISVLTCWGRCDSREISDWKFPYKKSYHPVCVYAGRSKSVAHLRFCHPLALPSVRRYEYMEADACRCQICSSSDTSCEAPNDIHEETSAKIVSMAGMDAEDLEY